MRLFLSAAAVAGVTVCAASAWAANTMLIESKSVVPGETGVTIGVYIENDVDLAGMVVPLEMREIEAGSYVASPFVFATGGRLAASGLMEFVTQAYFNTPAGSNSCSGPVSSTWSSGAGAPNADGSPDALVWSGIQVNDPCLAAGSDGAPGSGTPSFLFTFDVTSVEGRFEIDTCCRAPSGHLVFVECGTTNPILPVFTKGVITIGNPVVNDPPVALCRNVTASIGANCEAFVLPENIDDGSFDPDGDPITLSLEPPGPYPPGGGVP